MTDCFYSKVLMRVGILGSGEIGQRLGDGLTQLGYTVKIGTRDPNKEEILEWISSHGGQEGSIIWNFCRIFVL